MCGGGGSGGERKGVGGGMRASKPMLPMYTALVPLMLLI